MLKLALALFTLPALASPTPSLEESINAKVNGSTTFCSLTNSGYLNIACDGQDVFQGDARLSLAMKLLINKGLKPVSCNYSRGGHNITDVAFCAVAR